MLRKLITNILIAFVLFPIFTADRHWSNWLNGVYKIEDAYYETFGEYVQVYLHETAYPLLPFLFLILILLPFQLIKDYFNSKGKPLHFLIKSVVFTIFFAFGYTFLAGGYMGYMLKSNPISFWGPIIIAGILYPILLYFTIDRYVERK
ncbi:hypothetical protein [Sphingobacterium sp. FBM7-1]|uniref:hypothetical protein n=1 Tax=Sphingobacterium sp. FBM7-1 TaxID=2886688 RepID=UPI001D10D750|nr:hypothetical protein [Sphingobacterium sp. FBM7-1]MCC2600715.1 hypothetical protein [Sphingobacterium sp. FBM7-1]